MSSQTPSLSHRLGGRWAISRAAYIVIAVGIILSVYATEPSATESLRGAVKWMAVALGTVLVFGGYLIILDRWTPYRHRRERPIALWIAVLGAVAGGVVIAVVLQAGTAVLGLTTQQALIHRLLVFVVLGVWIGLALNLLLDEFDRSRTKRNELIERQVSAELANLQQTLLVDALRTQVVAELSPGLTAAQQDLQLRLDALASPTSYESQVEVAEMIRDISNVEVRALSTQLWTTATKTYPKVSWWTVLANALRSEPIRPVALSGIHVLGKAAATIGMFGFAIGAGMLAIVVAEIFVVSSIANACMRRYPRHHLLCFVAGALALQLYVIPMAIWREHLLAGSGSVSWMVTQFVAGIIVIVVVSGFGSWRNVVAKLNRIYQEELDVEQVRAVAHSRAVATISRDLSHELHGTVQSKLVACAMVSEHAIQSGDTQQLETALLEAQKVLTTSFEVFAQADVVFAVSDVVRRHVALWDELCAITLEFDDSVDRHMSDGTAVGRVVEEGLANAIRHGKATAIRVDVVWEEPGAARIRIEDNGVGLPEQVASGLGSILLDQATSGRWTTTNTADGTLLEARVSPLV